MQMEKDVPLGDAAPGRHACLSLPAALTRTDPGEPSPLSPAPVSGRALLPPPHPVLSGPAAAPLLSPASPGSAGSMGIRSQVASCLSPFINGAHPRSVGQCSPV